MACEGGWGDKARIGRACKGHDAAIEATLQATLNSRRMEQRCRCGRQLTHGMPACLAGKKQRITEPVGVRVLDEDEEPVLQAPEMQRLLRQPR